MDEVAGDPVEPGQTTRSRGLVPEAAFEGDPEDLAQEPVGILGSESAGQKPVDGHRMPVEDGGEFLRLLHRGRDHLSVTGADVSHHLVYVAPVV